MNGPIVNLNGASCESLLKAHMDVAHAAGQLAQALAEAAPHGRDYQTESTDSRYRSDRDDFINLVRQVDSIEKTYRRIAERLATEA